MTPRDVDDLELYEFDIFEEDLEGILKLRGGGVDG